MKIEIFGIGCPKCNELEKRAIAAVIFSIAIYLMIGLPGEIYLTI